VILLVVASLIGIVFFVQTAIIKLFKFKYFKYCKIYVNINNYMNKLMQWLGNSGLHYCEEM
jgi:hypothetical protein